MRRAAEHRDRIEDMRELRFLLETVLPDDEARLEWLYDSVPLLRGRTSISLIRSGPIDGNRSARRARVRRVWLIDSFEGRVWRDATDDETEREELRQAIFLSINGIAAAMQSTG